MKVFIKSFSTAVVFVSIIFFITYLLASVAFGGETRLYLDGDHVQYSGPADDAGLPVVIIKNFRDLPHDYTTHLPPELYYWWALAHNEKQSQRAYPTQDGTLRYDSSIVAPIEKSIYGQRGGVSHRTDTLRYYSPQIGVDPVIIYNPYFR